MSVFWLALAAFAIGTEAFVIAGLLPIMAADLNVTLAATGSSWRKASAPALTGSVPPDQVRARLHPVALLRLLS